LPLKQPFFLNHKMIFMRIAYLIMAHKNPSQIEKLIRRIDHPQFDVYIHLDKKTNIEDYAHLENLNRAYFIQNRLKVTWGGISIPDAVLASMQEIIATGREYDFITLMSGQDYTLRDPEEIYSYFNKRKGKNFLYLESLISPWWHEAIKRIDRYDMVNYPFRGRYRLQWLMNAFLPKKKFPLPYILYGGPRAAWFTITIECAQYIIRVMKEYPQIRKFFYYTWGADEFIFPTIIMNSEFKKTVVIDNDFLYVDWSQGGSSPKILTKDDFHVMKKSCCYFARKFDKDIDEEIFDLLDKMVTNSPSVQKRQLLYH
jgi:hypothetical protein